MKNKFIKAEPFILEKIADWLKAEQPESSELIASLQELADGRTESLVLCVKEPKKELAAGDIVIDDLRISLKSRHVTLKGNTINLTPKEFDILYFLAENRGEVFTKEQIYKAVWAENYLLDDSNIMAFIRKLRKKIEPNPDAPKYIITIWGIGYKFSEE